MAGGSHALQSLSGDLQRSQPVCLQEQRGNDALQSLSDDLISQEKASLPDSGSPTKTPGVVQQAQEKTAGALDYVEKQSQPQAGDKVRTEVEFLVGSARAALVRALLTLSPSVVSIAAHSLLGNCHAVLLLLRRSRRSCRQGTRCIVRARLL